MSSVVEMVEVECPQCNQNFCEEVQNNEQEVRNWQVPRQMSSEEQRSQVQEYDHANTQMNNHQSQRVRQIEIPLQRRVIRRIVHRPDGLMTITETVVASPLDEVSQQPQQ